ncbi:MAG TPA: LamG-like jellyroll fold domain-containing protein, partial [Bacteroidota bacterium]|nr:LamG-like jellyroll fold domain-containing protein [Bacteroidota bacterium]
MITRLRFVSIALFLLCSAALLAAHPAAASPYDFTPANYNNSIASSEPQILTNGVTNITQTGATLGSNINAGGLSSIAYFRYGLTANYADTTSTTSVPSDATGNIVTTAITGLSPNKLYHYQAVAGNLLGTIATGDKTFTTLPLSPSVGAITVDQIGQGGARISSNINSNGVDGTLYFIYGPVATASDTIPGSIVADSVADLQFTDIKNLSPNTTYFVEVLAVNGGGTGFATATFSTLTSNLEYTADGDSTVVGLYHFDGTDTAHVEDYSVYQHNGTSNAGVVTGEFGNARSFDLSTQYVRIPDTDGKLSFGSNSFTLECWIYPSLSGSNWPLMAKGKFGGPNGGSYLFNVFPGGYLELVMSIDGETLATNARTVNPVVVNGQWQEVAVVVNFTNQSIQFYYNSRPVASQIDGSFPTGGIFTTSEPLQFGLIPATSAPSLTTERGKHTQASSYGLIDEVRISNVARSQSDLRQNGGSFSGIVYSDLDGNGSKGALEPPLQNWSVAAYSALKGDTSVNLTLAGTALTDSNGVYVISSLPDGFYYVVAQDSSVFIQTQPTAPSFYPRVIVDAATVTQLNFGELPSCKLKTGANPSLASSWTCGHVPGHNDGIVFDSTTGSFAAFPTDSCSAVKISGGGAVTFNTNGSLSVAGTVQIDSGAYFGFGNGNTGSMYVYDNWVNNGIFTPGNSTVVFSGDNTKYISNGGSTLSPGPNMKSKSIVSLHRTSPKPLAGGENTFYNLSIGGANTSSDGNIIVQNQLQLD